VVFYTSSYDYAPTQKNHRKTKKTGTKLSDTMHSFEAGEEVHVRKIALVDQFLLLSAQLLLWYQIDFAECNRLASSAAI